MKTDKRHGMKIVLLVISFLFGCGMLASMYVSESVSRDRNPGVPGAGESRRQFVQIPVFSFLGVRFLSREAVSISRQGNADVLKSVFEVFDPSLRSFLSSVPIVLDSSADTAKAYPAKGYIGVSPDWDNTVVQSKYRAIYEGEGKKPGDSVFENRFKTDLLIHEFLHILQVRQGIDTSRFYEAVARWYVDPQYGIPSPNGMVYAGSTRQRRRDINRMKYVLWHELYNYRRLGALPQDESWESMQYGDRYRSAKKGVEEFAYIGQEILSSGSGSKSFVKTGQWREKDWQNKKKRLLEVSPEIVAAFSGVFNPELTQ